MDVQDQKVRLRTHVREVRDRIPLAERKEAALQATKALLQTENWRKANIVALFVSYGGEIDTSFLLDEAWRQEKEVLLPLCGEEPGQMQLVPCSSRKELHQGRYGILEPPAWHGGGMPPVPDLCIVPGIAFDRQGGRLGLGGGYYDRFFALAAYAGVTRIGLCFAAQLVDNVPCAALDLPVHAVATESGVLWINS